MNNDLMDDVTTGAGAPRPGRLLIGLYPARYRSAHGDDICATFAEATEGRPRRAVLREYRDLATHALRLRLRIGPTDPAGRVLAGAAPVALALAAGCALVVLLPELRELVHRIRYPYPNLGLGYAVLAAVFQVALTVPWLLALGIAVTGRWRAARIVGVAAALLGAGVLSLDGLYPYMAGQMAGTALVGTVVLLAPAGLVDVSQRGRWEMAGLVLAVAVPMIAAGRYAAQQVPLTMLGLLPIWLGTVTAPVLLSRLSGRRTDRLRAVGVGLGTLPWLMPLVMVAAFDPPVHLRPLLEYAGACAAPLGTALAVAGAVRLARRVRTTGPSDPA
ncbi:hypothetical protein ACFVH7_14880 [Kitasatospora indigofera]|uniref:hypothetical protein n=1 Tax=Kitasatospora indigofera TaxID=67307 RepID=UPI0036418ACC